MGLRWWELLGRMGFSMCPSEVGLGLVPFVPKFVLSSPLPFSVFSCGDTSAAAARVPSGAEAEANNRQGREGLIRRWRRLAPPGTWEAQVLIPKQILVEWNALLGCIHGIGVRDYYKLDRWCVPCGICASNSVFSAGIFLSVVRNMLCVCWASQSCTALDKITVHYLLFLGIVVAFGFGSLCSNLAIRLLTAQGTYSLSYHACDYVSNPDFSCRHKQRTVDRISLQICLLRFICHD
jgi:hypothetical protein